MFGVAHVFLRRAFCLFLQWRGATLGMLATLCCLGYPSAVHAQPTVHLALTMHADAVVAAGSLADVTSRLGGAFGIGLLTRIDPVPLSLGFDLAGLFMLSHSERHRVDEVPSLLITTTAQPRAFLGHAVLRLQSPWGHLQPYVEARAGLKHFRTRTTVQIGGGDGAVVLDEDSRGRATALSGGVGLGLEFTDPARRPDKNVKLSGSERTVGWSLSFHWLAGGRATFSGGRLDDVDGTDRSFSFRSRTDLFTVNLGVRGDLL